MITPKKNIAAKVKLQIQSGKANPAPPIGTALGPRGVNIMGFCKEFNERTKDLGGDVVTVEILIFTDKTFTFIVKSPPTSVLIKKIIGLASASKEPGRVIVGKISMDQIREIALRKMPDMNAYHELDAINMVIGTALSMGIEVIK